MSNSEKAKKLYKACENSDPKISTLMPYHLFERPVKGGAYYPYMLGILINRYATEEYEGDWIPFNRETFYTSKSDKEGWKDFKSVAYRMEKKGWIESKFEDNQNWVRLTNDDVFNPEVYKRKEMNVE